MLIGVSIATKPVRGGEGSSGQGEGTTEKREKKRCPSISLIHLPLNLLKNCTDDDVQPCC